MAVVEVIVKPCWECGGKGWYVEGMGGPDPEQVQCWCDGAPLEESDIFFATLALPVTRSTVRF